MGLRRLLLGNAGEGNGHYALSALFGGGNGAGHAAKVTERLTTYLRVVIAYLITIPYLYNKQFSIPRRQARMTGKRATTLALQRLQPRGLPTP